MSTVARSAFFGLLGLVVVLAGLYAAGYRITANNPGTQLAQAPAGSGAGQMGVGRGTPGWRKAEGGDETVAAPQAGSGKGARRAAMGQNPGNGQGGPGTGQGQNGRPGAGSAQGQAGRGAGGNAAAPGRQPGFGPSGGVLLPIVAGTDKIPVFLNGKEKSALVGQTLVDHVEDTVIATAEGPRKGWGVGKTLDYLGVKDAKEVVVYDRAGKKTAVTPKQITDDQTFLLLTYDGTGHLLLLSGPKVRGTNKGQVTREEVAAMVASRKDLVGVTDVVKIEIKG